MVSSDRTRYSRLETGWSPSPEDINQDQDQKRKSWKPWTIQLPFLIFFILLCALLTTLVEFLLQTSDRNGGLMFNDLPQGSLSVRAEVIFNYLPTTISVVFGLIWARADHNYKRLEPFFQLSKPGGVTAEDSILLDYSYSFPPFIPYKALKKRHWPVFYSSTMMLFTAFFLTPSMAGIFDQTRISNPIQTEASRVSLRSIEDRSKPLSAEFSYLAYNHAWLNSSLPEFTTAEYAILPFENPKELKTDEQWTGESILYEADLQCQVAETTKTQYGFNLSNGKDCAYQLIEPYNNNSQIWNGSGLSQIQWEYGLGYNFTGGWHSWFMGYANNSEEGEMRSFGDLYSLSSPLATCSDKNTFLGLWGSSKPAEGSGLPENFTAIFCEPTYWSQSVKVTAKMPVLGLRSVIGIDRIGDRKPFNEFNVTSFEQLAATGRTSPSTTDLDSLGNLVSFGYFPPESPNPRIHLNQLFAHWVDQWPFPLVNLLNSRSLAGLALSKQSNSTLSDLLNPDELGKSYTKAYKLLFSLAVASELMDNGGSSPTTISVTHEFETGAFVANTRWCRLSQAGFLILGFLTLLLLISTWNRKCNLDGEPNSLAALMQTLSRSPALCQSMNNAEYRDSANQYELLVQHASLYRLRLLDGQGSHIEVLETQENMGLKQNSPPTIPLGLDSPENLGLNPVERVWGPLGFIYSLFFASLLAILLSLYIHDKKGQGLPTMAPENSFKYKLLFSHLPTVLGTSIEPLWVVIGSYACMVAPYEILHRGQAPSFKTLTVDYDKTPPHFQTLQALKTRNFGLGALTTAIILTNILAVAFAGLFSPAQRTITAMTEDLWFRQESPIIWGTTYATNHLEACFVLAANLSRYSLLPSWTTPDFYAIPFEHLSFEKNPADMNTTSVQGETLAFGTDVSCQLLPENQVSVSRTTGDYPQIVLEIDHPCRLDAWGDGTAVGKSCAGFCWIEKTTPASDFFITSKCPGTFFVGWSERPGDPSPTNMTFPYADRIDSVVLVCNSSMIISNVSVTVDENHQVLSHNITRKLEKREVDKIINPKNIKPGIDRAIGFDDLLQQSIASSSLSHVGKDFPGGFGGQTGAQFLEPGYNPHSIMWINALMAKLEPNIRRQLTNATHIPNTTYVVETFERVYRSIYAVNLQVYADILFQDVKKTQSASGIRTSIANRVIVSTPMFIISTGILVFFLLLILWVHIVRPGRGLTHLPTSMAATHTLLYASDALDDCAQLRGKNTEERAKELNRQNNTYGYGFFTGRDGELHFGVHKDNDYPPPFPKESTKMFD